MNTLNDLIFFENDLNNIELIKNYIKTIDLKSKVYDVNTKQKFSKEQRSCNIAWISHIENNIVSEILSDLLNFANKTKWKIKLSNWQTNIQYTQYYDFNHHYDWHTDVLDNSNDNLKRLITIVYCLTPKSEYKGCKLEIKYNNEIFSKKLDRGDYVVFPSNLIHRATQLICGEREVLVGWYK